MICFEVQVNDRTLCSAGIGDLGVIHAIPCWVNRDPDKRPKGSSKKDWCHESLDLTVGGSIGHGEDGNEFWDWLQHHPISVGDEIRIRILSQDTCDPPANKRIETTEFVRKSERAYYESMKRKYAKDEE